MTVPVLPVDTDNGLLSYCVEPERKAAYRYETRHARRYSASAPKRTGVSTPTISRAPRPFIRIAVLCGRPATAANV